MYDIRLVHLANKTGVKNSSNILIVFLPRQSCMFKQNILKAPEPHKNGNNTLTFLSGLIAALHLVCMDYVPVGFSVRKCISFSKWMETSLQSEEMHILSAFFVFLFYKIFSR